MSALSIHFSDFSRSSVWFLFFLAVFSLIYRRRPNHYIRLHADVQMAMSGWREGQAARDVLKSITMEYGEQSAMTTSTTLTLVLSATDLDLGWYRCL